MTRYPLFLDLRGRQVLVVGAGRVAARRIDALVSAGARITVVAPTADVGLATRVEASAGHLRWHRRPYTSADLDAVSLVHACTDDVELNATVAREAEERHLWCVRADQAESSAAWVPASAAVDDVTVAISAAGDPRRASVLRDRFAAALHADPLPARPQRAGPGVVLIGGGPGDAGLITLRGYRRLRAADVVVTDRLGPRELLDVLPDDVEIIDVGKTPRGPAAQQADINRLIVERALAGQRVARLKGGDGYVFGRGAEEVQACVAAGVAVEVIPGVSSVTSAPALAGIPLTHRGITQEFIVATGHVPPGDRRSTVDWAAWGASNATIVLLMAVEHLAAIAATLLRGGRPGGTPVAGIVDASLATQRVRVSTLEAVAGTAVAGTAVAGTAAGEAAAGPLALRPPAVVVIGEVVALRS